MSSVSPRSHPREYPDVRARVRLTRKTPTLPLRQSYLEIWMKGSRFRVRDEAGRHVSHILGDVTEPRGLGVPPRTLEEAMDIWSESQRASKRVTEIYGDTATDQGWVCPAGQAPWQVEAAELAPAAEQILTNGLEKRLQSQVQVSQLGRAATEYHGFIKGRDEKVAYANEVTLVVSPPYVLLSDVRDAQNPEHCYTREIVSLETGAVSDADLTPGPAAA